MRRSREKFAVVLVVYEKDGKHEEDGCQDRMRQLWEGHSNRL